MVQQALQTGHSVTAFARNPAKLAARVARLVALWQHPATPIPPTTAVSRETVHGMMVWQPSAAPRTFGMPKD